MLGILAMRVVNGHGGVDKGSLVSIVRQIKSQRCSPAGESDPGIIIANPSELWWWPEGKRSLDMPRRSNVSMMSAVHLQRLHDSRRNNIPENSDPESHMEYIFTHVLPHLTDKNAKIDVIAVGHACEALEGFLGEEEHWKKHAANRLNALVLLGGYWNVGTSHGEGFKEFLETVHYPSKNYPSEKCSTNALQKLAFLCLYYGRLPSRHPHRKLRGKSQVSGFHVFWLPRL